MLELYVQNGNLTVSGGSITGTTDGISSGTTNTITISGGTITATNNSGVFVSNGSATISAGNITGGKDGIMTQSTGKLSISGGTITGKSQAGVYNYSTGTIVITGGKIIAKTDGVLNYTTGSLTIGKNDTTVSQTNPDIQGERYGISGSCYFYDGLIKGITSAFSSTSGIKGKPSGYKVTNGTVKVNNVTYQKSYLTKTTSSPGIEGPSMEIYNIQSFNINKNKLTEMGEKDVITDLGENTKVQEENITSESEEKSEAEENITSEPEEKSEAEENITPESEEKPKAEEKVTPELEEKPKAEEKVTPELEEKLKTEEKVTPESEEKPKAEEESETQESSETIETPNVEESNNEINDNLEKADQILENDIPSIEDVDLGVIQNEAQIGDNTFETLKQAINEAQIGDEIVVLKDINLTEEIMIDETKEIILNLNEKTLTSVVENTINNKGKLIIESTGIITNDLENSKVIFNDGLLDIESANIKVVSNNSIGVYNHGELNTANSKIEVLGNNSIGIYNTTKGTIIAQNNQDNYMDFINKITSKYNIIADFKNKKSSIEIIGEKSIEIYYEGDDASTKENLK